MQQVTMLQASLGSTRTVLSKPSSVLTHSLTRGTALSRARRKQKVLVSGKGDSYSEPTMPTLVPPPSELLHGSARQRPTQGPPPTECLGPSLLRASVWSLSVNSTVHACVSARCSTQCLRNDGLGLGLGLVSKINQSATPLVPGPPPGRIPTPQHGCHGY